MKKQPTRTFCAIFTYAFILMMGAGHLSAQVPSLLEYDGYMTGNITGNRTIGVKLYSALTNGTLIYKETIGALKVTQGQFYFQYGKNGTLGNGTTPTGISAALSGPEQWVAITVNGTEQTPRQRLLSVPFALRSGNSGNTVLSGTINPATTIGANGDFYINTANRTMYGPKTAGAWGNATTLVGPQGAKGDKGSTGPQGPQGQVGVTGPTGATGAKGDTGANGITGPQGPVGAKGDAGLSGRTILSGAIVPAKTLGADGDFYLNTANRTMYGPKTAGAWGNATTLVGAQGPQGLAGATGATGAQGLAGATGPAGATGAKGETGATGATGPQGPVGATGSVDQTVIDTLNLTIQALRDELEALRGELKAAGVFTDMVSVAGGTLPSSSGLAGQVVATFQIGKYEVTWGEWKSVRDWAVANGYSDLAGVGDTYPSGSVDNFPVINVNWYDVVKWSNARSDMEGLTPVYKNVDGTTYKAGEVTPTVSASANGYRLPSEKEWEWAARGGISTKGYTYSGGNDVGLVAWYSANSDNATHAVATKAPNELGIYDMSGNAMEWCRDVCIRGGMWLSYASYVAISERGSSIKNPDDRGDNRHGFRLARSSGN